MILFPGEAEFRQCKSCPTGRVYYMKISTRCSFRSFCSHFTKVPFRPSSPYALILTPILGTVTPVLASLTITSERREFFWMQDASAANDSIYCQKLNNIINGTPTPVLPPLLVHSRVQVELRAIPIP